MNTNSNQIEEGISVTPDEILGETIKGNIENKDDGNIKDMFAKKVKETNNQTENNVLTEKDTQGNLYSFSQENAENSKIIPGKISKYGNEYFKNKTVSIENSPCSPYGSNKIQKNKIIEKFRKSQELPNTKTKTKIKSATLSSKLLAHRNKTTEDKEYVLNLNPSSVGNQTDVKNKITIKTKEMNILVASKPIILNLNPTKKFYYLSESIEYMKRKNKKNKKNDTFRTYIKGRNTFLIKNKNQTQYPKINQKMNPIYFQNREIETQFNKTSDIFDNVFLWNKPLKLRSSSVFFTKKYGGRKVNTDKNDKY